MFFETAMNNEDDTKPGSESTHSRVEEAIKRQGFDTFADYIADRSTKGLTLVEMAKELNIPASTFINAHHARFIDSVAGPLRVVDTESEPKAKQRKRKKR